jgi:hypothetical protein
MVTAGDEIVYERRSMTRTARRSRRVWLVSVPISTTNGQVAASAPHRSFECRRKRSCGGSIRTANASSARERPGSTRATGSGDPQLVRPGEARRCAERGRATPRLELLTRTKRGAPDQRGRGAAVGCIGAGQRPPRGFSPGRSVVPRISRGRRRPSAASSRTTLPQAMVGGDRDRGPLPDQMEVPQVDEQPHPAPDERGNRSRSRRSAGPPLRAEYQNAGGMIDSFRRSEAITGR